MAFNHGDITELELAELEGDPHHSRSFTGVFEGKIIEGRLVRREEQFKGQPGRNCVVTKLGEDDFNQPATLYIDPTDCTLAIIM